MAIASQKIDQEQSTESINPGKATLLLMNEFGLVIYRQVSIEKAYLKDNHLALHYKLKGERKTRGTLYKSSIAVFDGWIDIPGTFSSKMDKPIMAFVCFEESAFDDALAAAASENEPVFIQRC